MGDSYKYGASGFVLSLTNPCDYIVNGYRIGYNLFGKDIDFIWLNPIKNALNEKHNKGLT